MSTMLSSISQRSLVSDTDPGQTALLEWAKASAIPLPARSGRYRRQDLAPLGRMIGDATVVLLSEGEHFIAEPLELRNELLAYLVEEKGFTAIAIESGVVEGRVVHDYVRGGAGDLDSVVAAGISWTFDRLPQNRALVQWLREYNAGKKHAHKVNFYGFDVAGSPGNPQANRGLEISLTEVLNYLDRVDGKAAIELRQRLAHVLPNVRFDPLRSASSRGYHRVSQAERDSLTATIADLNALLARREAQYASASSTTEWEWAVRAAIGARQADSWLRQTPTGCESIDQFRYLDVATDLRDRAQADNLAWIIEREGPSGKVLVYAHNNHMSSAAVKRRWFSAAGMSSIHELEAYRREVAGTYLRRHFGDRLVAIGNLIGKGRKGCPGFLQTLEQAALPESLDGIAAAVGVPRFLLDLRTMPRRVGTWLAQERALGRPCDIYQHWNASCELPMSKAFDIVFCVDTVTPACGEQDA